MTRKYPGLFRRVYNDREVDHGTIGQMPDMIVKNVVYDEFADVEFFAAFLLMIRLTES